MYFNLEYVEIIVEFDKFKKTAAKLTYVLNR